MYRNKCEYIEMIENFKQMWGMGHKNKGYFPWTKITMYIKQMSYKSRNILRFKKIYMTVIQFQECFVYLTSYHQKKDCACTVFEYIHPLIRVNLIL